MTAPRSRPITPDLRSWQRFPQLSMLRQDFDVRIVPYQLDRRGAYALEVDGRSPHSVERSLGTLESRNGVDGFIHAVGDALLTAGELWIQVVIHDESSDQTPFQLIEVNGISRGPAEALTQELPSEAERRDWLEHSATWEAPLQFDPESMVHATLPAEYPRELVRRVACDLSEIPLLNSPDWAVESIDNRAPKVLYDLDEARRTSRQYILQVASPIGWPAREMFFTTGRVMSEFYLILRELRFLHFLACIRASAEAALVEVLTLVGQRIGMSASVIAHNVYTPEDMNRILDRFQAGDLPLLSMTDILLQQAEVAQQVERRVL